MTDYIIALDSYRNNYLKPKEVRDANKGGLGAPTVEKEVTKEAEEGNIVANMLYGTYDANNEP